MRGIRERLDRGVVVGAEGYLFELERRGYVKAGPFVPEVVLDFPDAVRELPGVLMVFHLTGVTDYLVWVAAADAQDLREFVVDHLATHPAVAHAETSLIYEARRGPGIWGAADPPAG